MALSPGSGKEEDDSGSGKEEDDSGSGHEPDTVQHDTTDSEGTKWRSCRQLSTGELCVRFINAHTGVDIKFELRDGPPITARFEYIDEDGVTHPDQGWFTQEPGQKRSYAWHGIRPGRKVVGLLHVKGKGLFRVAASDVSGTGECIQAPKVTKYLSTQSGDFGPDSVAKLTWSPEFCPNGDGWRVLGDPVLAEMGAGDVQGVGINLEAAARESTGVEYRGQVKACLPVGASYKGFSYKGDLCDTVAKGEIGAAITPEGTVVYRFPALRADAEYGNAWCLTTCYVWSDKVV